MIAPETLDEVLAMVDALYEYADSGATLAVDTESTGFKVGSDDVAIGLSVSYCDADGPIDLYVPLAHLVGENADDTLYEAVKELLEHWTGPLVMANVVFDVTSLASQGIDILDRDLRDVIPMAHMLNENTPPSKSLDSLGEHYVGRQKVDDPFIEEQKSTGWPDTDWRTMWDYACTDTSLTLEVYFELERRLRNELGTEYDAFMAHKADFYRLLATMYRRGVRVDQEEARQHIADAERIMEEQKGVLGLGPKDKVGPLFLTRVLHEELGIPVLKASAKTNKPSFDKEAMELYEPYIERAQSPVGQALKTFRGWQKASSASSKAFVDLVESDGRLRCSYKMHGTVTGRLSCEKPNLQQIPKAGDKPWNGGIKGLFIPDPGMTLINADFSQLELRLGTAYAGEETLKRVFEEGRDIFDEMAAELGWPRQDTKTFVYSTQYGAGKERIMSAFGVDERTAIAMLRNYRRTYPRFGMMNDQVKRQVEKTKRLKLWSGRIRHFRYPSEGYKGWNSLIQGGAADLMERCMVHCFKTLDSDDCRILLQVHDSLTWEVRTDLVEEMMPRIKAAMEAVTEYTGRDFGVRFAVEVEPWSKKEVARLEQFARAA